jgi:asparagine synthase (glutamine-hydrolysing)
MCGIAGIVGARPVNEAAVRAMTRLLAHRGPDDEGFFASDDGRVQLGHRRLSIIDTSSAGHQPMIRGAQVITFNGEIYNYRELAARLADEGVRLRSASDTEVLLAAYGQWGTDCLAELNGMFAFAIFDGERNRLFCARDRFGEKPFLYHANGGFFAFASEYKSLFALAGVAADYDPARVLRFLHHPTRGLDDDAETVFQGIRQLPPAHSLILDTGDMSVSVERFWDVVPDPEIAGLAETEAQARFAELLTDSVRLRMRADVPLGSCLSGGLDSSAIVCIARREIGEIAPYDVFTGRFPGAKEDEWEWAEKAIQATRATSHSVAPTASGLLGELAPFIWHNELPVAGTSQYAQWCVFRLARDAGITVLLDGQGGDELLGGYEQYFEPYLKSPAGAHARDDEISRIRARYPLALASPDQAFKRRLPQGFRHWAAGLTGEGSDFSFGLTAEAARSLHGAMPPPPPGAERFHPLAAILYTEALHTHLPVLLRYGDRNSMAHSLEVRLPFCDHRLAEFALSLPAGHLMGGAQTKRLLRGAMAGILPDDIRLRWNKQGFLPPQAAWFRDGLLALAQAVIGEAEFRASGVWRAGWWDSVLKRFGAGEDHLASMLWRPVMENAWRHHFVHRVRDMEKHSVFREGA